MPGDCSESGVDVVDLSRHNIFDGLDAKDFDQVLPLFKEKALSVGDVVFSEGDEGDGMFFIIEGAVRIEKSMPDGHKHIIATLEDGELFGEMSLLTRARRTGDCLCERPGRLWWLQSKDFDLLERVAPTVWTRVVHNIGRLLCGRLTAMTDEVVGLLADLSDVHDDVAVFEKRLAAGRKGLMDVLRSFGRSKVGIPSLRGGVVKEVR